MTTCHLLSAGISDLDAQAFAFTNDYIATLAAWVERERIGIPVISDFLTRTTTATLAGLNQDGSARRATIVFDGEGKELWRFSGVDNAELPSQGALDFLRAYRDCLLYTSPSPRD